MPSGRCVQSLRTHIGNGLVLSDSGRFFLPDSNTSAIFTKPAIDGAVTELDLPPDERIGLAEAIHATGIKTFAILIWMKEESSIVAFRNHQALDARLPISEALAKTIAPGFGVQFAKQEQWSFLPFKFPQDMHKNHLEVSQELIMPFIGPSEVLGHGSFGRIVTVNISPPQQAFFPQDVSLNDIALLFSFMMIILNPFYDVVQQRAPRS